MSPELLTLVTILGEEVAKEVLTALASAAVKGSLSSQDLKDLIKRVILEAVEASAKTLPA